MSVRIATSKKHRWNQRITNSIGSFTFNEKGVIEVDESIVSQLLKLDNTLSIVKETVEVKEAKQKEEVKETKQPEKSDEIDFTEDDLGDKEMAAQLQVNTIAELQAIVRDGGLPKKEWEKLKKADLIEYIIKKSKE